MHNKNIALADFILQLKDNLFFNYKTLIVLFVFTFLNWFFEILKWKNLITAIDKISFSESLKQSFGSLTASLFTPNRVGEYGVKLLYFKKELRKKVLLLNLVSNVSQMIVTLLFGVVGLIYMFNNNTIDFPLLKLKKVIYYFVVLLISIFGGKYFISKKTNGVYLKKINIFIKSITLIRVIKTIVYSIFRYLIFSHQFYYLLLVFGVEIDYFIAMKLIFAMYLIASVIPSLPMFDWLIKGTVAVFVFSTIKIDQLTIVTITIITWLFNFGIPSIIGSYFVLNFKHKLNKK